MLCYCVQQKVVNSNIITIRLKEDKGILLLYEKLYDNISLSSVLKRFVYTILDRQGEVQNKLVTVHICYKQ